jgi:tRNA-dihydrouridine synthase
MVAMVKRVVSEVALPITVKTRIGFGPEREMPILDLARRLEDVGIAALTIHCRTAAMGHTGAADWSWAARAQEQLSIPVVVNGDIRSAEDAKRAFDETGCAAVMVGRAAIEHPWIFREARALLDESKILSPPTREERIALVVAHLHANVAARGERFGVQVTRRHLAGYLRGLPNAGVLRRSLLVAESLSENLRLLEESTAIAV